MASWIPLLSVRRIKDGREFRQLTFAGKPEEPKPPPTPKDASGTSSTTVTHLSVAAFSPDGRTVAAARRLHCRCTTSRERGKEERVRRGDRGVRVEGLLPRRNVYCLAWRAR